MLEGKSRWLVARVRREKTRSWRIGVTGGGQTREGEAVNRDPDRRVSKDNDVGRGRAEST